MQVSSRPPRLTPPAPPATTHRPGPVRDLFERGAGALGALKRAPGALISGLAIGAYQGARKGADAEYRVPPGSVALGLVSSAALQSVLRGAATGFVLLGPLGAGLYAAKEAGESSLNLYLFLKGGSAAEMGQHMADALDAAVPAGAGAWRGAIRGAGAGVSSAVRSGASTGYQEGRAAASGLIEGLRAVPAEFAGAGVGWKRALQAAAGALSAAFAAPAGLAVALCHRSAKAGPLTRKLAVTGATAAAGALAGLALGPVGLGIGLVSGAAWGLLGPASGDRFAQRIGTSVERARQDDADLGSALANRRRDLVQQVVVGAVSGARQGWDLACPSQGESAFTAIGRP